MNQLSKESSPYLLQHKDNPVDWFAWNDAAWNKAKAENKLVLISIGYSSCHWCHVMEHQVFEDFECAEFMNSHFVCIKVDREERPDVDSVYMDAVHLMGGKGGWPLNVFALPDGRPVYGGTYFPKPHWLSVLENLVDLQKNDVAKMNEYASRLGEGLQQMNLIFPNEDKVPFDIGFLDEVVSHWSKYWDMEKGGARIAPKFPMPNNLLFAQHYGFVRKDPRALEFVDLTLTKMAMGGIYDQVGGGFARYSVDDIWKVPHFEKMLYDNAQLMQVYALAYKRNHNSLYLSVIEETFDWLEREMKSNDGLYYSALDADSEGVEGKFYVWTEIELRDLLDDDFEFAVNYYRIGKEGYWEEGNNILLRVDGDDDFSASHQMTLEEISATRMRVRSKLLNAREARVRPGLDHKCQTSWNAMMISALLDAYAATKDLKFMRCAESLMLNIRRMAMPDGQQLFHVVTNGKPSIPGFLDDYAFLAEASIKLFEKSGNEEYLHFANGLVDMCLKLFYNESNGLFFFTSSESDQLITRKYEVQDNVIPASNSAMCKVLFMLGKHLVIEKHISHAETMLRNILPQMNYASGYSNWLQAYCWMSLPFYEVVITGPESENFRFAMDANFIPNALIAASTKESELPLFNERFGTKTAIYVCTGNSCLVPQHDITDALSLIR